MPSGRPSPHVHPVIEHVASQAIIDGRSVRATQVRFAAIATKFGKRSQMTQ
jgi:hypothetical protein